MIKVSAPGIMMDEKYFPNPTRFNPENFSKENRERRNPLSVLMFGHGPRNCIGKNLGLLQIKTGIAHLVREFKIVPTSNTVAKLEMDPKNFNVNIKGGILVTFERRDVRDRWLSRNVLSSN